MRRREPSRRIGHDNLKEALSDAQRWRVAAGHFNVSDLVALKAVTGAARTLKVPVLIGTSEGERDFSGGLTIVHISTELRLAWHGGLEAALAEDSDEVVPYKIYGKSLLAMAAVADERLRLFNVR